MKKCILCILIFATIISATACSSSGKEKTDQPYNTSTTTAVTTASTESKKPNVINSSNTPSNKNEVSVSLNRSSCALNNGFNSKKASSDPHSGNSHSRFELFEASISGAKKQSNGSYIITEEAPLTVSITLLQDINNLPKGNQTGWWNWYSHYVPSCTYTDDVYGTDISGDEIGLAAYYIEVEYADGSTEKFHECNFANGMSQNTVKNVVLTCKTGVTLAKVSIVIVYRTYCEFYTNLLWGHLNSDWRVEGSVDYSK